MAQIDLKMSKHKADACYAYSARMDAALREQLEQAWASMEAALLDVVLVWLCSEHGKVDNLHERLAAEYNKKKAGMLKNNDKKSNSGYAIRHMPESLQIVDKGEK